MSTVVAFTPVWSRQARRSLAEVVPIEAARGARQAGREAGAGGPSLAARPGGVDGRRAAGPAPLRLTRRGRAVLAAVVALLVSAAIVAAVLLVGSPAVAGDQVHRVPSVQHVVLPGETLWSIAGAAAPGADPRETISRIQEFNALSSVSIRAGQRIAIPADLAGR